MLKRFWIWVTVAMLLTLGASIVWRPTEADTVPRMLGMCMNPSGAMIPIATSALGQAVAGGYQSINIMGQNSGTSYYLQCDSSGNIIITPTNLAMSSSAVLSWNSDTGISRTAAATVGIGSGAQGNVAGTVQAATFEGMSSGNIVTLAKSTGLQLASGGLVAWTGSSTNANTTLQTTICQSAAGVVEINSGTGCGLGGTVLTSLVQAGTIYSAAGTPLPTCNTAAKGTEAVVSDATTPSFLGSYSSGGAVVSPVVCNGSGWVTY